MSFTRVDIGFVPLTDAATLIVAHEMGFAAEEGLELVLHKEVSWSNIRDKVSMEIYPMAQMLSPLALAMSLGLSPVPAHIIAPFVLNHNGNTMVTSRALFGRLQNDFGDAATLKESVRHMLKERPLRIGIPYPQSMHRELINFWLSDGIGEPLQNVEFSVAPPSMLGSAMGAGEIDAFMVGEPWGSLAVERGDAQMLLCGASIWNAAPEKVLGVHSKWAEENADTLRRLIRSLFRASLWAGERANASSLAELLAKPDYIGISAEIIERALIGELIVDQKGQIRINADVIKLSGASVTYPSRSDALWICNQVAPSWGVSRLEAHKAAAKVFRPDIYRAALESSGVEFPEISDSLEFFGV